MDIKITNDCEPLRGLPQTELHINGKFEASWDQVRLPDPDDVGRYENMFNAMVQYGIDYEKERINRQLGLSNWKQLPVKPVPTRWEYELNQLMYYKLHEMDELCNDRSVHGWQLHHIQESTHSSCTYLLFRKQVPLEVPDE